MDACNKMTKEQALKEMELFKAVFDGGRRLCFVCYQGGTAAGWLSHR